MKTIKISDALFAKLQGLAKPLIDNVEDVIWRLIRKDGKINSNHHVSSQKREKPEQFVHSKGGKIRCPLKLRMIYKRTTTYGEARDGWIWFEGKRFTSPSAAAKYVAKMKGAENPSFDGWRILEYSVDDNPDEWQSLNNIRNKTAITKTEVAFTPSKETIGDNVTGKKPKQLRLNGQVIPASTWKEVMIKTFELLLAKFPDDKLTRLLRKESHGHDPYQLRNGKYIELNRSAEDICKHCREAVKACGLTPEKDWAVTLR